MKCKRFAVLLLSLVLCLSVILQPINGYCNTVTESGSNNLVDWVMDFDELIENDFFIPLSKIYSLPFVVWDYSYNITLGRYMTWLHTNHPDLYDFIFGDGEEKAQVIVHGGGGYSRLSDKINNSESIEVPEEVATTLVQYVQYEVTQQPLGYVGAYIYSYNFLSPTQFNNYAIYQSVKQFISSQDGYVYLAPLTMTTNNTIQDLRAIVVPYKLNFGFYGTVSSGSFTNVNGIYNWSATQQPWTISNEIKRYYMNGNGQWSESTWNANNGNNGAVVELHNISSLIVSRNGFGNSSRWWTVFSPKDKNEFVYVFSNVNAYKNYNSGQPQSYYLTDQGINTPSWSVSDGYINTGQMSNVGNVYNNIVNNSQTGMTADEVQKLIESILDKFLKDKTGGGTGGGSSDGSDFDLGFLGTIGRLIGSLITGIGDLLSGIIGGIVDTVLSLIDMITGEDGIINKLTNLFDTNIGGFLTSIFDWLPPEIITLWSAGIIIGILFGILRIIRG